MVTVEVSQPDVLASAACRHHFWHEIRVVAEWGCCRIWCADDVQHPTVGVGRGEQRGVAAPLAPHLHRRHIFGPAHPVAGLTAAGHVPLLGGGDVALRVRAHLGDDRRTHLKQSESWLTAAINVHSP